jgi:hypothetical protein
MKIDFKTKKTEAEWQKTLDDFWMKATPKWFEWSGWIIILGAFTFLSKTQENMIIKVITGISYIALFFYFQSFFFSFEFHGIPFVKFEKVRRIISLTLSALLSYGTWLFLCEVVSQISGKI